MKGVRASLALLTRIPVGRPGSWPRYTAAWLWLPGLLAGMIWYASYELFGSTGLGMIAAVGGEAALTGVIHWRGLANTMDGLTSAPASRSWDRRTTGVQAAGVLFIGLALLAFWSLWTNSGTLGPAEWLLPPLWARAVLAWGFTWRRVDRSSRSAHNLFRDTEHGAGAWITLLVALIIGVYVLGFQAVEVLGGSLVAAGLFLWWASRLFRGLNEDVLFAGVLVAELVALVILAVVAPPALF